MQIQGDWSKIRSKFALFHPLQNVGEGMDKMSEWIVYARCRNHSQIFLMALSWWTESLEVRNYTILGVSAVYKSTYSVQDNYH